MMRSEKEQIAIDLKKKMDEIHAQLESHEQLSLKMATEYQESCEKFRIIQKLKGTLRRSINQFHSAQKKSENEKAKKIAKYIFSREKKWMLAKEAQQQHLASLISLEPVKFKADTVKSLLDLASLYHKKLTEENTTSARSDDDKGYINARLYFFETIIMGAGVRFECFSEYSQRYLPKVVQEWANGEEGRKNQIIAMDEKIAKVHRDYVQLVESSRLEVVKQAETKDKNALTKTGSFKPILRKQAATQESQKNVQFVEGAFKPS